MKQNDKFKVGVIFCGGCNPYFDRAKLYKEIVSEFSASCDFMVYSKDKSFDIVLLINGCQSECLMEADYNSPLVVLNDKNYMNFFEEIQTILHRIKK